MPPVSIHGCLEFADQKSGVGAYTDKPSVLITYIHTNLRLIKKWGWVLTWRWTLSQDTTVPGRGVIHVFQFADSEQFCSNTFHITKYPTLKLMRHGQVREIAQSCTCVLSSSLGFPGKFVYICITFLSPLSHDLSLFFPSSRLPGGSTEVLGLLMLLWTL